MAKRRRRRFRGSVQEHLRSAGQEYRRANKSAKVAIQFAKKGRCEGAVTAWVFAETELARALANQSWGGKYRIGAAMRITEKSVNAAKKAVYDHCVVGR